MSGMVEGKVAIVTGSSKGIGRACAEVLIREGATVVGCSREDVPDHGLGAQYTHAKVDVTDTGALEAFVRSTADHAGRLDILVNNAGTHPPLRTIDEVSVDEFRALLDLNLTSYFVASRAALPYLRLVQGSIVNMGSAVGVLGQDRAAAYCATKAGIIGMTKSLAIDEASYGVRVNCVCPAAIATPMTATSNPAKVAMVSSIAWLDRWGTANDVAEVVAFLASDRNGFVTGQDLLIAGGSDLGYGLKAGTYLRAHDGAGR